MPALPPSEMRRYGTAGPPGNPTGTPNPYPTASPPSNKPATIASPSATSAAWLCIATIATPTPLPPVTAKSACRYLSVFRYGQCRHMAGGMTLLVAEMRHQRFSKKNRDAAISLAARLIELRPRRELGGLRQEYRLPVAAEGAFDGTVVAAGRDAGTGRFVDANPPGAY